MFRTLLSFLTYWPFSRGFANFGKPANSYFHCLEGFLAKNSRGPRRKRKCKM